MENKKWIGYDIRKYVEAEFNKGQETVSLKWGDANTVLLLYDVLDKLNYKIVETKNIPYAYEFKIGRKGELQNA